MLEQLLLSGPTGQLRQATQKKVLSHLTHKHNVASHACNGKVALTSSSMLTCLKRATCCNHAIIAAWHKLLSQ